MILRSLYISVTIIILFFITGCVESLPLTEEVEVQHKLFIECELQANEEITAYVSRPGYLNGNLQHLPPLDTSEIYLTLSELNKDYVVHFKYNERLKHYFIDSSFFKIQKGVSYVLKGFIIDSDNEINIMTETPGRFLYDSVSVVNASFVTTSDNKVLTTATIRVYYNPLKNSENHFLHLELYKKQMTEEVSLYPQTDKSAFFRLAHRNGILVDMTRMENKKYFDLLIEDVNVSRPDSFNFYIKNTTKPYYDYQKFKSNVPKEPLSSGNPAIAAFNINNTAGYGTFSSSFSERINISLK
ncbi:MAG: DUF4249 family protein [Saprospiraceae bacterium]|nr:DUF4249 family protein [Saprospiraceae bacterium]